VDTGRGSKPGVGGDPAIAKIVPRHLMMGFSTTYLCERDFSTLLFLENKYRNKLNVGSDLRLKLSSFYPNIDIS